MSISSPKGPPRRPPLVQEGCRLSPLNHDTWGWGLGLFLTPHPGRIPELHSESEPLSPMQKRSSVLRCDLASFLSWPPVPHPVPPLRFPVSPQTPSVLQPESHASPQTGPTNCQPDLKPLPLTAGLHVDYWGISLFSCFKKWSVTYTWGFPGGASGKEPTCQCRRCKTQVRSLGRDDPLEKGMATLSSIPAWRIPWTGGPGEL